MPRPKKNDLDGIVAPRERAMRAHRQRVSLLRYSLSQPERRFAEEFISDPNLDAAAAAARAGYDPRDGRKLLAKPLVQDEISRLKSRSLSRCEIYGDAILRNWKTLAEADPTELQYSYRAACRRCWGVHHRYQFNDAEFAEALAEYDDNPSPSPTRRPFDAKGGPGYTRNREPMRGPDWLVRERRAWPPSIPFTLEANSDHSCPACHGDGELVVVIRDTRSLSPAGKLLFDGFKQTAGFVVVNMRDRFRAEEYMARFAGLFNDRRQIEDLDPDRLTDEQLNIAVARLVERGVVEIEGTASTIDINQDPDPDHVTDIEVVPVDA